MKEKDNVIFYDTKELIQTEGLRSRANKALLEQALRRIFPDETICVKSVEINDSGKYKKRVFPIKNLPPYCSVKLEHSTGRHTEYITVWSPLAWNGRFIGTAGGGTATGGESYITRPNNTSRGMTLPMALLNGFTAATTDAANRKREWALDKETGKLDWERIENWRARSTHFMTLAGKAVAELLHQRPVLYSYLHGGSGGGRQSMVEAQEFPEDYDGIWASCPAIHWTKFVLCGLWPIAVMNSYGYRLPPAKIKYFRKAAQDAVGGEAAYYKHSEKVNIDPYTLVGQKVKGGEIRKADADIMQEIWNGPHRKNAERLWYGFRPGVLFWNVGIPVGAFYYTLLRKKPKPFILSTYFARWVTQNPKQRFGNITMEEFETLFDKSIALFGKATADNPNLAPFAATGGKLMIDHGMDDPLIPVDGTMDYYNAVCNAMGGKDAVDAACKLYITPGDGHGSCNWHGPGLTESDGMRALMRWVENGIAPQALRVVQVTRSGKTVREGEQNPF